jgi:outer membrane cobalamin receptor
MWHLGRALVVVLCCAGSVAAGQRVFEGHRLEEALRVLQRAGLPIVFSSEVVKPDMRVAAEPRSTLPRQQLDELLAPHGLKAEGGPGRRILIVPDRSHAARERAERATRPSWTERPRTRPTADPDVIQYSDTVTVWGLGQEPIDRGSPEATFKNSALHAAGSVLASDGLDAVRAMPSVVAADDFGSDFSVRSSPARQVGIVIDGVATPWLQHTIYGRRDAGSLSMFASDIIDRVTLRAGAYPRRYADALGAQIEVSLKEGSRDATHVALRAGGTSASLVGEGPIGSDGRGSWIAGVRNSFRTWPPRPLSANDVGFAFADGHAKLVYDFTSSQQASVTVIAGRSALDTLDEPMSGPLGNGTDRAGLFTVGWRSIVGARTVVRQRVSLAGQELVSQLPSGELVGRSDNRSFGYQGELVHSVFGGLLEAGTELFSLSGARDSERAGWGTRAAYVNFARAARGGLSLEGGARVSDSTLVRQPAVSPWLRGAWRVAPTWTVTASAGASRQFPNVDVMLGAMGGTPLVPERATHVDVAIERRLPLVRWQATLFNRFESDVLDALGLDRYRNALLGTSRGLELVVSSVRSTTLSGWLSYTYASARQRDTVTRETFWSDADRRHAVNAAGMVHLGPETSVAVVVRGASGMPIPGYFDRHNGLLVVGGQRNDVRLPAYVRVDARVQRTFFSSRHAVTIFGEVLNVLNRQNEGLAEGVIEPATGEAIGFARPLMPRKLSFGIEVSLSR